MNQQTYQGFVGTHLTLFDPAAPARRLRGKFAREEGKFPPNYALLLLLLKEFNSCMRLVFPNT
jgi:hypothetical protein